MSDGTGPKVLLAGYSCYGELNNNFCFITSYSITYNTNILKSNAFNTSGFFGSNTATFQRLVLGRVRDNPTIQIQLSVQLTDAIYQDIISNLCGNYFHEAYKINFHDNVTGTEFKYTECYVTSVSFAVARDGLATLSLSASYFSTYFNLSLKNYPISLTDSSLTGSSNAAKVSGGEKLLPYYKFSAHHDFFKNFDIMQMGWSFQQTVTPKYGCIGSSATTSCPSPGILGLTFGLPVINYNVTYLVYNKETSTISPYTSSAGVFSAGTNNMSFYCIGSSTLILSNCIQQVYAPRFGNKGDVNTIQVNGTCLGCVSSSK